MEVAQRLLRFKKINRYRTGDETLNSVVGGMQ